MIREGMSGMRGGAAWWGARVDCGYGTQNWSAWSMRARFEGLWMSFLDMQEGNVGVVSAEQCVTCRMRSFGEPLSYRREQTGN